MTTMLTLTLCVLIALLFVLKRLRPLSEKTVKSDEIKDANNNLKASDSEESGLPLSSKNCYITLVQHDDEQNECTYNKNSKTKHLLDNDLHHYDTSSTNVLCLSDEQQRTVNNNELTKRSSSQIS